jgi:hypothetical protein
MKVSVTVAATLLICGATDAFVGPQVKRSASSLSMVLEMPKQKKLQKIETLKIDSDYLRHPLAEVRCVIERDCGSRSFGALVVKDHGAWHLLQAHRTLCAFSPRKSVKSLVSR